MRAGSVCWEIWIQLSDGEISRLESECLKGEIKVRDRDSIVGEFPLEVELGDTGKEQLYVKLKTVPQGVYFEDVTEYKVIVSKEGYRMLNGINFTGDRMYNNPACKISVCGERYEG